MFRDAIPLSAHQKAADYTVAKTRFGIVVTLVGVVVLLFLTLGGGIERLSDLVARAFEIDTLAHGALLLLAILGVQFVVHLPFAFYRTFVIEQRFGFNRTTLRLYL